jgi:hypothetical protein
MYRRTYSISGQRVPSSPILVTVMEAIRSCETSVKRATRRTISEDDIIHNYIHLPSI